MSKIFSAFIVSGVGAFLFYKAIKHYLSDDKDSNERYNLDLYEDKLVVDEVGVDDIVHWFKDNVDNGMDAENKKIVFKPDSDILGTYKINEKVNLENEKLLLQVFYDEKDNVIKKLRVIYYNTISVQVEELFKDKKAIIFN